MSETFDPYRKWLGIQPAEQPPDHYRLLGIVRFEDDPDTISNAADRQMAHVRMLQTGLHSVLSQKLLNEIAAARVCLLNAAKKSEYDRQLRDKESTARPIATPATSELVLRPISAPPTPVARVTPPAAVRQSPASTPRVAVPQAQRPETVPNSVIPAPIGVGPIARRPPPKVAFRQPRREQSDAHNTLFIAAAATAIALGLFVAYKMRGGGNGKTTHDVVAANQLVADDADKARKVGESPQASQSKVVVTETPVDDEESPPHEAPPSAGQLPAPQPPTAESTTDSASIWVTLTRRLNDLDSWKVVSGEWSERDGRLHGEGDSRLTFEEELPDAFLLSCEMKVVDGMRPRIIFGDGNFHFGNEGFERTLFVHDGIALPIVGAPRPYETGAPVKIACRISQQDVEFLVNGKLVARCGRQRPGPLKLTLSAGDPYSPGQVVFGPFTVEPAPSTKLTPTGSSSDSVDLLALVDVLRDRVNGEWKRDGSALVSPKQADARQQLPYSPGRDYELTVVAERLAGTESFIGGLVIGGRQVAMTLDGYGGETAGLADLDKHDGATNESTRRGRRLAPGQPHTVVCTVHAGSVRVTCDGQEALVWSGDAARLSNSVFWDVPDKRRLYLGAWDSVFKYTRVEVRPLAPEEKPAPPPPSVTTTDAPWRDLFDGKSLAGWTGDVRLMRVQNGVLANNGKKAIVMAPGDYQDFELEIEFRLVKDGNSGLGICYSGSGDPSQNGLEIQIIDDAANSRLQDKQRCGAVYGLAGAKPGHFKRWPEWNTFRVASVDDKVQVELNGTLVTDTTRSLLKQASPQHPGVSQTSGKVCLFPIQGRSEYRHMRIRSAK